MRRLIARSRLGSALAAGQRPARSRRLPRRRVAPRWLRPALWCGAVVLALAAAGGTGTWLWTSGRVSAALEDARSALVGATVGAGLTLDEVYVAGRRRTPREAILEALGVARGDPLVTFDPAAARRRVEALGWVREAAVERRFPDTVFVRLTERVPLALWQRKGRLFVVDGEGVVIDGARVERFARLPLVVGDEAARHAADLLAVMASEPGLRARIAAAVRVGGRRWNLRLDNGIEVQLPEQGVAAAWRRLAEYDRRHRLLARKITVVDLRLPGRLVVRRAPDAGPAAPDPKGKST